MSDETAFVPTQECRIHFDGDEIVAVLIECESLREVSVPIRQFCDFLGLDWLAQRQRLLRDEVLAEDMTSVGLITTLAPYLCSSVEVATGRSNHCHFGNG